MLLDGEAAFNSVQCSKVIPRKHNLLRQLLIFSFQCPYFLFFLFFSCGLTPVLFHSVCFFVIVSHSLHAKLSLRAEQLSPTLCWSERSKLERDWRALRGYNCVLNSTSGAGRKTNFSLHYVSFSLFCLTALWILTPGLRLTVLFFLLCGSFSPPRKARNTIFWRKLINRGYCTLQYTMLL